MTNDQINKWLIDVLSEKKGYFGRVYTWGQRPYKYEYIGYELDTDFTPTLDKLSEEKKRHLLNIIFYFDIHAGPLRHMLELDEKDNFKGHSHEWAWSHFMTVVMFGMLEVAVKSTPCAKYDKRGHLRKCISIKYFLESYLPKELRDDIAKRYKTEDGHTLSTFPEVVEHLWSEIRSGFIHEGSLNFKGMEWNSFKGIGSKNDPMTIVIDVPMQELLQITWLAILNSYGYTGRLELPKYKV